MTSDRTFCRQSIESIADCCVLLFAHPLQPTPHPDIIPFKCTASPFQRITNRTIIINYCAVAMALASIGSFEHMEVCSVQTIWFFFSCFSVPFFTVLYVTIFTYSQCINFSNMPIEYRPTMWIRREPESRFGIHKSAFIFKQNEYWTFYDL